MTTIIYANRKRVPVVFLISLTISLLLIMYLIRQVKNEDDLPSFFYYYYIPAYIVLFLYAFIFMIISGLEYIKTTFSSEAVLTINDSGLNDNLSLFSCGSIPWQDISGVTIFEAFKAEFLIIKLRDPHKYLSSKNFLQRIILKRYVKRFGTPVVISEKRINYNIHNLHNIIMEHIKMPG